MKISVIYNKHNGSIVDVEYDDDSVPEAIAQAFVALGHNPIILPVDKNLELKLREWSPDFAFNIAEGSYGPSRESQVPLLLENLNIPHNGPSAMNTQLFLNKALMSATLSSFDVAIPPYWVVSKIETLDNMSFSYMLQQNLPLIVKPIEGGSSMGIDDYSVVENFDSLKDVVSRVLSSYNQPTIVQKYVPGREFSVAVIGYDREILPVVEVTFNDPRFDGYPHIDGLASKWDWDTPQDNRLVCPADIPRNMSKQLERTIYRALKILPYADAARFDIRYGTLDSKVKPYIVDINTLPGINPDLNAHSRFIIAGNAAGLEYVSIISRIFESAKRRYSIDLF